jgi:hypothetical protein
MNAGATLPSIIPSHSPIHHRKSSGLMSSINKSCQVSAMRPSAYLAAPNYFFDVDAAGLDVERLDGSAGLVIQHATLNQDDAVRLLGLGRSIIAFLERSVPESGPRPPV